MSHSHGPIRSRSISSTLLAQVRLHDDRAWEKLVSMWQPIVYHWCRRAGAAPHDAEEIVQNVFLRVSRGIRSFERQSFSAWIRTITRRAIAEHFRKHVEGRLTFAGSASWLGNLADPHPPEPADGSSDAATLVDDPAPDDTRQMIVRQALEVIRSEFQETTFRAFWRTAVDSLSAVEVGRELGMTPEAVRQAKSRVLRRLRVLLDGML